MHRSRLAPRHWSLILLLPLAVAGAARGEPLTSASFTLSGGSFAAGGAIGSTSEGFRLDGTIGPSTPAGVAVGASGRRLESGPWPFFLPPPIEDRDGDGMPDGADNCVDVPNADQADVNAGQDDDASLAGVQHYGDACDADLDDDGVVAAGDFFAVFRPCLGEDVVDAPECAVADLDGDGFVGSSDFFGGLRPALGLAPGPGVTEAP